MISLSRNAIVGVVLLLLLLVALIAAVYYIYLSPTGLKARETSPLGQSMNSSEALYTSLEGVPLDIRVFEGELLIVNMWASWSPFTKNDHVVLSKLKEEFGNEITVRAVNRKENKETAIAYLDAIGRESGIEYSIDTTDFLYSQIDGYAMPETVVFDQVGNVVARFRGVLSIDDVRTVLVPYTRKTD